MPKNREKVDRVISKGYFFINIQNLLNPIFNELTRDEDIRDEYQNQR